MFKIMKYLGEFKASVIAVIFLLILQAYCDLSLPSYTSDIVDVGIEQGGIENAVPEIMREETFNGICLLTAEDVLIRENYQQNKDGNYELKAEEPETVAALDEVMREAIVTLYHQGNAQEELSDTMAAQMAVMFVRAEYEALGLDLNAIQTRYLLTTGGKMLLMTILMMTASIAVGFLAAKVSAGIGIRLRNRVFRKVVSFSHAEMDKFSTASLITRSTNDIQQVQMVAVMLLRMVCYAPILGIGGIIKVINTRTGMGWIIVVAVVLILALVGTLMKIAMPKFKLMQTLVDRMNLVSREILTGIPVIRAFSREKYEEERFDKANKELMSTQIFTNRVMTFMMPTMMLIMNAIAVAIVWFGSQGIDMGNLQIGDMMAFITYSMQIVMSFLMLTMISVMLPRAGVAAERIEEIINTESTILDTAQVQDEKLTGKGIVAFENVNFRYPGAEEDALSDISFVAEPGKTTAIIGSTGCGKSTLLHLIPRFYDVTGGKITIDGIDIRELSQKKLRSMLGFVPQKGVLFSGTIASNLKFAGEEKISDEMMREAAEIAQAKEFIESKNEKYESPIAQGGTNVSGGQKQRLSIARAIAGRPEVFLFDDSFSALDYKTDAVLRKALYEKIADATVIIVAQRISTILHADQIIVLDEGKIAGIGKHEELLQNCTAYQEIAKSQLSEAELKGGARNE
jgi:ATP-binding cassette subfamily B protein